VDGDQSSRQNAWREIGAGLRFIAHHPVLRALTGAAATSSFFGGFYAALYALYVLKAVGLNTTTLGLLIGAGGIGGLAGSFQAGRVSHRWGTGRALIVTLLLASALNLLIPLARNPGWAAILLLFFAQLVGDFFGVIYNIVETSVRQAAAPDAMLGRVTASYDFVAYGIGTIGIFVGGLMGSAIGMRNALIVAAFGLMSAAIWLLASPVRHMDRPPTEKGP
jgi:predicted MFS family arabinose efflux permease